jgi:Mg/Co/Ni transporter MgtE
MAAPDDNLNDDIMADIINAGTKADVDDTSQYFADYEDILNIPVVEDQQIVTQENTGEVYLIIYHLL